MRWLSAAWFLADSVAFGQETPLIQEVISREYSMLMVSDPTQVCKEVVSREYSFIMTSDPTQACQEVISREVSFLIQTYAAPNIVSDLVVSVTSAGNRADLSWSNYNEIAQHDVAYYRIYVSTYAFTNVSSMTPYTNVSAGTYSAILDGLPPWQDRFFAIVAVDTLGGFNPNVICKSAYVLGAELISREYSMLMVSDPTTKVGEVISREFSMVVATYAVPSLVSNLTVSATPNGDTATLDWSSYNEIAQNDVARYDIYWSASSFASVTGLTPQLSISAGTYSVVLTNLAPWQDRYFAVVPVDVLDGFDPTVRVAASYLLAREVISREYSLLLVSDPTQSCKEVISREVSFLIPEPSTPAPVTYAGSPFTANTSTSAYRAIDLDWSFYNEQDQYDVMRYRIYIGQAYFTDAAGMTPFAYIPAGTQACSIGGLQENAVYSVAVVAEDVLGNWNPVVRSVYATASAAQVFQVNVKAWLQGPYMATSGLMRAAAPSSLPLASPYAEDTLKVSSIDTNVTDWMLCTLRNTNGQVVTFQSAWIRKDGSIVSPGATQMLWKVTGSNGLFMVLKHRNHLGVMTATPVIFTNQTPIDFSSITNVHGGTNAAIELNPAVWGLRAGDADGDGEITPADSILLQTQRP